MRKLLATILTLVSVTAAAAESYPSRRITLVVPLAAGGSTDLIGRLIADGMKEHLGQTVTVENTSGGGGTIGVGRVARAEPDGYTILIGHWGTNVATGAIYSLSFDIMADLEPIALIATQPFLIVARKNIPADNLAELIAWLKANASQATQGNSGVGTPSHVAGILFQKAVGAQFQLVPYRSAGQSMQDLVAGSLDINLDTPAISMPQLKADNIKAFAVTAKSRIAVAPHIPTTDEAGLPGFYFSFWHALWAPKGTPKEIIQKLNDAAMKTLADPAVRQKLENIAQDIFPAEQQTPAALRAYQKAEIEEWWPIIKAAEIKPQ
jgi:tripartite-type tricarboxylate transporter receptor subunit TctC